jgi:hypothetical protein
MTTDEPQEYDGFCNDCGLLEELCVCHIPTSPGVDIATLIQEITDGHL